MVSFLKTHNLGVIRTTINLLLSACYLFITVSLSATVVYCYNVHVQTCNPLLWKNPENKPYRIIGIFHFE